MTQEISLSGRLLRSWVQHHLSRLSFSQDSQGLAGTAIRQGR